MKKAISEPVKSKYL